MAIKLDSFQIESPEAVAAEQEAKRREKVKDLLPIAQQIKEAATRVTFQLDTEGANAELDRLREAANLEGFSLRLINREAKGAVTTVTVKAGKLIKRGEGEQTEQTEQPAEVATDAKSK